MIAGPAPNRKLTVHEGPDRRVRIGSAFRVTIKLRFGPVGAATTCGSAREPTTNVRFGRRQRATNVRFGANTVNTVNTANTAPVRRPTRHR